MKPRSICVVGLGYIGLPTAVVLAQAGYSVTGCDIDADVCARVAAGAAHFSEPGLSALVADIVGNGSLRISDHPVEADAFVICVPTPLAGIATKRADISAVLAAGRAIGAAIRPGNLVILESTSPPGTTIGPLRVELESAAGLVAGRDFLLAHCPERVLPGRMMTELVANDRVVGGLDSASTAAAAALYRSFASGTVSETDATTAELVKLMENTYRDVNIALANEFALVSESLGIDVWRAIDLANRHPRVNILRPGPGVGGHCIAVDPWFVVGSAPRATSLIATGRAVNDAMPGHVADRVTSMLGGLRGRVILALGSTYKANVDDERESASLHVIEHLRDGGADVRVHDAVTRPSPGVSALADGADCLVLLVDHDAYARLDPSRIGHAMRRALVLDCRDVLDRTAWTNAGFTVERLGDGRSNGRPTTLAPVAVGRETL